MRNYAQLFAICKAQGFDYKDKVAEISNGRTDSLKALTDAEYREMMLQLQKHNAHLRQTKKFEVKPGDKQRKKMIALAKNMGAKQPVDAVNNWCLYYGHYKKPLMQHTENELNQVLHIYETKVYASYLRNLNWQPVSKTS